MGKKENYESRVERYLLPLVEEHHFELVDVEYVKEAGTWYLRAYIDKEGGIAVDDCEVISRKLGEWLDKEDFIEIIPYFRALHVPCTRSGARCNHPPAPPGPRRSPLQSCPCGHPPQGIWPG